MAFNNLGLALGMTLKFYISVTKGLKLNVGFRGLGANSYVCRSYRGKTVRGEAKDLMAMELFKKYVQIECGFFLFYSSSINIVCLKGFTMNFFKLPGTDTF